MLCSLTEMRRAMRPETRASALCSRKPDSPPGRRPTLGFEQREQACQTTARVQNKRDGGRGEAGNERWSSGEGGWCGRRAARGRPCLPAAARRRRPRRAEKRARETEGCRPSAGGCSVDPRPEVACRRVAAAAAADEVVGLVRRAPALGLRLHHLAVRAQRVRLGHAWWIARRINSAKVSTEEDVCWLRGRRAREERRAAEADAPRLTSGWKSHTSLRLAQRLHAVRAIPTPSVGGTPSHCGGK